ncbi:MAG: molybdate ABC transporter substrate-binding protein [Brachymonas sp.]
MLYRRVYFAGLSALAACSALPAFAQTESKRVLRIAAASDLQFALTELTARFEREADVRSVLTFGSSGNLSRQLEQGLPADLFLSADEALIHRLHQGGWARDTGVVYARGRLAWLVQKAAPTQLSGNLIGLDASLGVSGKLAIANPDHAPYGRAARAALQTAGLWHALQNRLVLGENVSQATQFVSTGSARAGLVALSLAVSPAVTGLTRHVMVNEALHPPIIQRMALHRTAPTAALEFYTFLQTEAAKKVFAGHGLR